MKFVRRWVVLVMGMVCASLAFSADEATIKKTIEDKLNIKVKSVKPSGYAGLYEVFTGHELFYVDEKLNIALAGELIDLKTMKNVSQDRMTALTAVNFSQLKLANAVKIVRGSGKRVMATFEDPRCGYCKRLAKDMTKLTNVTIYTFILPILGDESVQVAKKIWCSRDRAAAWQSWMLDNKAVEGRGDCNTKALTENVEFSRDYAINGTPALLFSNGQRFNGAVSLDKIEQALNSK